MSFTTKDILNGLEQAREAGFNDPSLFPQVVRQVLNFVTNDDILIKYWCSTFLKDVFESDTLKYSDKVDLAIDTMESLIYLSNVEDLKIFKHVIDIAITIFKLVFQFVAENDGCEDVWANLNKLKMSLTSKFNGTWPLKDSDDEEKDRFRNLLSKIELIKFIIVVIDYQTYSNSNVNSFNCRMVNINHSLIKRDAIQAEATSLLNNLLDIFKNDVLVPPLINPVIIQLSFLMKRKDQFVTKILTVIENFETHEKLQSNYQTIEEFKLSRKYVDRIIRIFLIHLQKFKLIPGDFQSSMNKKVQVLIERGDEIRRKNIVDPSPLDENIKKVKFTGFANFSKKVKSLEYKDLYSLNDESNQLNFDLSTLPPQVLVTMIMTAMRKVEGKRLNKALDIVSERYKYALENQEELKNKRIKLGMDDEDDDEDDGVTNYDTKSVYNLPPPKELSFQEKREQINMIIRNFFKLSETNIKEVEEAKQEEGINKELTKIAIKHWEKKSWLVILTRLATRGMRTIDSNDHSIDNDKNSELSDLIRNALMDFFLENIHARIDLIIEWLNEEWYSETVYNELKTKNEIKLKYMKEYESGNITDLDYKINEEFEKLDIPTPIYDKWSTKILTSIIPFLEANDRKIFIRLLSDLPVLSPQLVGQIKSLCVDPVRSKLGFLSIQYLLMFRPPVKEACLDVLKQLSEIEDSKEEAEKLLAKFSA
ncbi:pre-tRNA-processing protein Pta1p [[Candida] jaroonii]|uniref:Pre-tRNA-processing protein Pta1p n=1 Tax=[Candida] jaroonii TaxID=467808 RepID=A0ACA9Y3X8_9ASCO|nr:pre-tRNA-processing protein Pta1p [[Candida] jaroonii]